MSSRCLVQRTDEGHQGFASERMNEISFDVRGRLGPKGSRVTGFRNNGSAYSRPASIYEQPWTDAVAAAASRFPTIELPYQIELEFRVTRPKKSKYQWPSQSDLDKLERGTADGLVKGGVIVDDRHIIKSVTTKRYTHEGEVEGVTITVSHTEPR